MNQANKSDGFQMSVKRHMQNKELCTRNLLEWLNSAHFKIKNVNRLNYIWMQNRDLYDFFLINKTSLSKYKLKAH